MAVLRTIPRTLRAPVARHLRRGVPRLLQPRLNDGALFRVLRDATDHVNFLTAAALCDRPTVTGIRRFSPPRLWATIPCFSRMGEPSLEGASEAIARGDAAALAILAQAGQDLVDWGRTLAMVSEVRWGGLTPPMIAAYHAMGEDVCGVAQQLATRALAAVRPLDAGEAHLVAGVVAWSLGLTMATEQLGMALRDSFLPHAQSRIQTWDAAAEDLDRETAIVLHAELAVDLLMLSGAQLSQVSEDYHLLSLTAQTLLQNRYRSHRSMSKRYHPYWTGQQFNTWKMAQAGFTELDLDLAEFYASVMENDDRIQGARHIVARLEQKAHALVRWRSEPARANDGPRS